MTALSLSGTSASWCPAVPGSCLRPAWRRCSRRWTTTTWWWLSTALSSDTTRTSPTSCGKVNIWVKCWMRANQPERMSLFLVTLKFCTVAVNENSLQKSARKHQTKEWLFYFFIISRCFMTAMQAHYAHRPILHNISTNTQLLAIL